MKREFAHRLTALCLVLAALTSLFALAGCDDGEPVGTGLLSVSFLQSGQPTIVRRVAKGGALAESDIPIPVARDGYTITWDRTDFSHIETDLVVRAVETPVGDSDDSDETQYCRVTYDLGVHADATITAVTQLVPIGEEITLYRPYFAGDPFSHWQVTVGGSVTVGEKETQTVYPKDGDGKPADMCVILAGDVTLAARWQSEDEKNWTERF